MFDCSLDRVQDWKNEHGLTGVNMRLWETWDKYFPDDVRRLKRAYEKYYNWGWKHAAIADEMGLSPSQLTRFKDRYYPNKVRRKRIVLTEEQKKTAKENGIAFNTAEWRIRDGMDPELAIRKPTTGKPDPNAKWSLFDHYTKEEIETAEKNGISRHTIRYRHLAGWDKNRVLTELIRGKEKTK
jgi:uncharacterized protein YjcR